MEHAKPETALRYVLGQRLAAASRRFPDPHRLGFSLAWLVLFLPLATIVALILWSWLRPNPLVWGRSPLDVSAPEVRAGQAGGITMIQERCNRGREPVTVVVARRLVDYEHGATVVELPVETRIVEPGCQTVRTIVPISAATPPGVYRVEGTAVVDAPWRRYHDGWYSARFRILLPLPPLKEES